MPFLPEYADVQSSGRLFAGQYEEVQFLVNPEDASDSNEQLPPDLADQTDQAADPEPMDVEHRNGGLVEWFDFSTHPEDDFFGEGDGGVDPKEADGEVPAGDEDENATGHAGPAEPTACEKNGELSTAVPLRARLPNCALSAVEANTWFPLHIQVPEFGLRLYRNGWNTALIARYQLHARGGLNDKSQKTREATLRWQVLSSGRWFFSDPNFKQASQHMKTPTNAYNGANYALRKRVGNMYSATLIEVANGVVNWPSGEDAGVVTQAIRYAVENNDATLTTEDIPRLTDMFQAPAEASTDNWDQNARERAVRLLR